MEEKDFTNRLKHADGRARLLRVILQELDTFPPVRVKVFRMVFIEELSIFEVATKLNITVDTVRVQKARAFHAIRKAVLAKGISF